LRSASSPISTSRSLAPRRRGPGGAPDRPRGRPLRPPLPGDPGNPECRAAHGAGRGTSHGGRRARAHDGGHAGHHVNHPGPTFGRRRALACPRGQGAGRMATGIKPPDAPGLGRRMVGPYSSCVWCEAGTYVRYGAGRAGWRGYWSGPERGWWATRRKAASDSARSGRQISAGVFAGTPN